MKQSIIPIISEATQKSLSDSLFKEHALLFFNSTKTQAYFIKVLGIEAVKDNKGSWKLKILLTSIQDVEKMDVNGNFSIKKTVRPNKELSMYYNARKKTGKLLVDIEI